MFQPKFESNQYSRDDVVGINLTQNYCLTKVGLYDKELSFIEKFRLVCRNFRLEAFQSKL